MKMKWKRSRTSALQIYISIFRFCMFVSSYLRYLPPSQTIYLRPVKVPTRQSSNITLTPNEKKVNKKAHIRYLSL